VELRPPPLSLFFPPGAKVSVVGVGMQKNDGGRARCSLCCLLPPFPFSPQSRWWSTEVWGTCRMLALHDTFIPFFFLSFFLSRFTDTTLRDDGPVRGGLVTSRTVHACPPLPPPPPLSPFFFLPSFFKQIKKENFIKTKIAAFGAPLLSFSSFFSFFFYS